MAPQGNIQIANDTQIPAAKPGIFSYGSTVMGLLGILAFFFPVIYMVASLVNGNFDLSCVQATAGTELSFMGYSSVIPQGISNFLLVVPFIALIIISLGLERHAGSACEAACSALSLGICVGLINLAQGYAACITQQGMTMEAALGVGFCLVLLVGTVMVVGELLALAFDECMW